VARREKCMRGKEGGGQATRYGGTVGTVAAAEAAVGGGEGEGGGVARAGEED